jgi:hypothetical protein
MRAGSENDCNGVEPMVLSTFRTSNSAATSRRAEAAVKEEREGREYKVAQAPPELLLFATNAGRQGGPSLIDAAWGSWPIPKSCERRGVGEG